VHNVPGTASVQAEGSNISRTGEEKDTVEDSRVGAL